MKRYKTTLVRNRDGFASSQSIGVDAFNAIQSIPFAKEIQIESESEEEVEISYLWTGPDDFNETNEYLTKYHVMKKFR